MSRRSAIVGLVVVIATAGCAARHDAAGRDVDDHVGTHGVSEPVAPAEPSLSIGIGDIVRYGDAPQQFAELILPDEERFGAGPHPVVVFIHGGFWRNTYDLSLAQPQAIDARARGYATWNIEYRRVGDPGGGYPGTLADVGAAIDALDRVDAPIDVTRVAVVGHSAGGHLALWVGQRDGPVVTPQLIVAQAPVADLANSLELSRGAVIDFMGGGPEEVPEAYDVADPARRLPIRIPQLIVHGDRDDSVPLAVVEPYVGASGADFVVFDDTDHFDVIDPAHRSWSVVMESIDAALAEAVPSN